MSKGTYPWDYIIGWVISSTRFRGLCGEWTKGHSKTLRNVYAANGTGRRERGRGREGNRDLETNGMWIWRVESQGEKGLWRRDMYRGRENSTPRERGEGRADKDRERGIEAE